MARSKQYHAGDKRKRHNERWDGHERLLRQWSEQVLDLTNDKILRTLREAIATSRNTQAVSGGQMCIAGHENDYMLSAQDAVDNDGPSRQRLKQIWASILEVEANDKLRDTNILRVKGLAARAMVENGVRKMGAGGRQVTKEELFEKTQTHLPQVDRSNDTGKRGKRPKAPLDVFGEALSLGKKIVAFEEELGQDAIVGLLGCKISNHQWEKVPTSIVRSWARVIQELDLWPNGDFLRAVWSVTTVCLQPDWIKRTTFALEDNTTADPNDWRELLERRTRAESVPLAAQPGGCDNCTALDQWIDMCAQHIANPNSSEFSGYDELWSSSNPGESNGGV